MAEQQHQLSFLGATIQQRNNNSPTKTRRKRSQYRSNNNSSTIMPSNGDTGIPLMISFSCESEKRFHMDDSNYRDCPPSVHREHSTSQTNLDLASVSDAREEPVSPAGSTKNDEFLKGVLSLNAAAAVTNSSNSPLFMSQPLPPIYDHASFEETRGSSRNPVPVPKRKISRPDLVFQSFSPPKYPQRKRSRMDICNPEDPPVYPKRQGSIMDVDDAAHSEGGGDGGSHNGGVCDRILASSYPPSSNHEWVAARDSASRKLQSKNAVLSLWSAIGRSA